MGIQTREESSDSAEENERRKQSPPAVPPAMPRAVLTAPLSPGLELHLDASDKEKPVMLLNHFPSSSARPTAQVLPVQNDAGSGPGGHHALPMQMLDRKSVV